ARFRIGYAPDSGFLLRDALRREFDEDLLRESGLFSWKESSEPSSQLSALSKSRSFALLKMTMQGRSPTRTTNSEQRTAIPRSSWLAARSPRPSIPNSATASCSRSATIREK